MLYMHTRSREARFHPQISFFDFLLCVEEADDGRTAQCSNEYKWENATTESAHTHTEMEEKAQRIVLYIHIQYVANEPKVFILFLCGV